MNRFLIALFIVAALVSTGCEPKAAANAEDSAKGPGASTPAKTEPEAPAPTLADLPAELKHDGFEYYGLGNTEPVDMELRVEGREQTFTGAQTMKLTKIEGDTATFELQRTGGLEQLGSMTLSLEKDGVYVTGTTMGEIDRKHLEIPAKVAPGTTWKADSKITRSGGGSVENRATLRVVGPEKVKTKAGEFDALKIQSSGPGTQDGQEVQMASSLWMVKGRGIVRMEVTVTPKGGKPVKMVLQEVS